MFGLFKSKPNLPPRAQLLRELNAIIENNTELMELPLFIFTKISETDPKKIPSPALREQMVSEHEMYLEMINELLGMIPTSNDNEIQFGINTMIDFQNMKAKIVAEEAINLWSMHCDLNENCGLHDVSKVALINAKANGWTYKDVAKQ